MATIYRFIIEQGGSSSGKGGSGAKKGAAKKGKWVSLLNSQKGGVEHNRKLRAINPVLNKMTGGWWEKSTRLGRAGAGLIQTRTVDGKRQVRFSAVSIAIILAFALQMLMKMWQKEKQYATKQNAQDFKQMEDGYSPIHGAYEVSVDVLTGRRTFNENK